MKKYHLFLSIGILLSLFLTACSETEVAAGEFENWQ